MYLLISNSTNPYFNLATEEYLLKQTTNDYCFLYRNAPSVICGKHQIPYKEIHIDYVNTNKIQICRRLSGGGTVYHDYGNINFSFIHTNHFPIGQSINFQYFITPIVKFLKHLNIAAETNNRNNILIESKKVSGNAEHISKNRILHHGTLLYDSSLYDIYQSIRNNTIHYKDKSVASAPADITNISFFVKENMSVFEFMKKLADYLLHQFSCILFEISENQLQIINQIMIDKYITDDWIYKYSPKYEFQNTFQIFENTCPISLQISNGIIENIEIKENCAIPEAIKQFIFSLQGKPHIYSKILSILNHSNANILFDAHTKQQFLKNLF